MAPSELLSADTFFVGSLKGVGKVYLHAVVDTCGSYAFGFLHVSKQPDAAVAVLHNDVLPFYRRLKLEVTAVLTDNGGEFCGTERRHPYELHLDLKGIEHRRTKVRTSRTNGFVERSTARSSRSSSASPCTHQYNTERPHLGYRNQGRRPIETITEFVRLES